MSLEPKESNNNNVKSSGKSKGEWKFTTLITLLGTLMGVIAGGCIAITISSRDRIFHLQVEVNSLQQRVFLLEQRNQTLKEEIYRPKGHENLPSTSTQPVAMPTPLTPSTALIEIEILEVPKKGQYPDKGPISGKITGLDNPREYRVVIYARTDAWYVQPTTTQPFTGINTDGTWSSYIHLGDEYAAVVATKSYEPAFVMEAVPVDGGDILKIARKWAK